MSASPSRTVVAMALINLAILGQGVLQAAPAAQMAVPIGAAAAWPASNVLFSL
jgi:hypothetical protein